MFKTLFATLLLSTSIATPTLKADVLQPKKASNSQNIIYGSYNYKSDLDSLFDVYRQYGYFDETLTFYDGDNANYYNCSFYKNSSTYQDLYLHSIKFVMSSGSFSPVMTITYELYDLYANDFSFNVAWDVGDDNFVDISNNAIIFNVFSSIYVSGLLYDTFNAIYTHDDNIHTTTYNGYYNFTYNGTLTDSSIYVTGSCLFNNSLYLGFSNFQVPGGIRFYYYDVENSYYSGIALDYPFTAEYINYGTNILINNGKMPVSTYTYLSSVGVFSYVRDANYDNTGFQDLLFSIMDSPIYMITRLLSFELFGVNLFVALTGLLTIVVILVLIRKFF